MEKHSYFPERGPTKVGYPVFAGTATLSLLGREATRKSRNEREVEVTGPVGLLDITVLG